MRKWKMMVLVGMFASAMAFAQGGKETPSKAQEGKQPVTLRVWAGIQPEYGYDEMVQKFNEAFKDKGIQAEYVRYVNNGDGNLQLETYLMSGGDIDVFISYGGTGRLIPRIESGLVLPLDDLMAKTGFDIEGEMGVGNVKSYKYDGKFYAIPTKYENGAWIMANVDMFKAAGVELPYNGWTYDQFREACKKLTHGEGQDKVYGMNWFFSGDVANGDPIFYSTLGAKSTYKDADATETNYDDPAWKAGMQLAADTMLVDKTAITYDQIVGDKLRFANTFLEGKCAMQTGISQIRLVKDTATYPHDFMTAIIPGPVPTEKDLEYWDHAKINGAGDLICIASKTEHPEECAEFVKWYIQGGMAPLAKGGRIPLWTGVSKDDVIKAFETGAEGVFDADSLRNYLSIRTNLAEKGPTTSVNTQINTILKEEEAQAFYGRKSVDQALKDAKSRADALLKK
ncbi:MAG: extracellular solute-binding protein [Spirochaetaceae bacterium]|nr:extracellular solute-binding protein [Spirochaetaceae bacterium]